MSFTRFHDDPNRIKYALQISTYSGRYALDTPGPGLNLPYIEDPHMRIQQWGANRMTNDINLENDLRGLTRKMNRDNIDLNDYNTYAATGYKKSYPIEKNTIVDESRATHPAWCYRDLEQSRWESPMLNPQANVEKRFQSNIQTRILEKDYFTPVIPVLGDIANQPEETQYYLSGRTMCLGGNCPKTPLSLASSP
jgi:hypothetical protein